MNHLHRTASLGVALALFTALTPALADSSATVGGVSFVNKGLVGVGRIPAGQKDKFGETFGSGSGMSIDAAGWTHGADGYKGSLWLLPDRGYNVVGTTDYRPRLNTIEVELAPTAPGAAPAAGQEQSGVKATLADTMLLTDDKNVDATGLDPLDGVRAAAGDLPILPEANGKLALDNEAIVRLPDGSMFISDEYGPNIYRFSADGHLMSATQPPAALVPMRHGAPNFASDNPGPGAAEPDPKDPETGRQNNQGLEGMAMTPDGKFLIAVLQSATRQDGGDSASTRQNTRALVYDASDLSHLKLAHEYVVPLPVFKDAKGKTKVAAQSEILALSDQSFLMLARDSGNGQGQKGDASLYREISIVDVSAATDIAGGALRCCRQAGRAQGRARPVGDAGQADAVHRHQRQGRARPLRPAQWRPQRPRQFVGEVGGDVRGQRARSEAARRLFPVRRQRQRLPHPGRLPGRRVLQGRRRRRCRHHVPGLPGHASRPRQEITLGKPAAAGWEKVHVEQACDIIAGLIHLALLPSSPPWTKRCPPAGAPAT